MSELDLELESLRIDAEEKYRHLIRAWLFGLRSSSQDRYGDRCYIAGPMRGVRFFNYPEFLGAKDALEAFDFKVLMADLSEQPNEEGHTDTPLKKFMQHDLPLLCQADCVFVLPGWQNSHGAKVEVHLAFQLDIPVYDITTGKSIEEGPGKAACDHRNNHFDRSLCACGNMHTYCDDCGDVLDDCPYEQKRDSVSVTESKRHPVSERVHEILREAGELHDLKARDYGMQEDPLKNVRNSEDFGVPAWVGCSIRLNDKVKRLQTMAQRGSLSNESAIDSFMDIIVYAAIGLVLFEETTR